MHHKSTVKKTFKVLFFFIQALMFISGIGVLIVGATVYTTSHELLEMPPKILVLSSTLGMLEVLSGVLGYTALASRRRLRMFVYVAITLILMNAQAIMAVKSSVIHERSNVWADRRWGLLSENQRDFVQSKFRCCGFLSPSDRSGPSCAGEGGCAGAIHELSRNISTLVERVLMLSFFLESVGIGILSMLRLRK